MIALHPATILVYGSIAAFDLIVIVTYVRVVAGRKRRP